LRLEQEAAKEKRTDDRGFPRDPGNPGREEFLDLMAQRFIALERKVDRIEIESLRREARKKLRSRPFFVICVAAMVLVIGGFCLSQAARWLG
jgi:hypothetical protein